MSNPQAETDNVEYIDDTTDDNNTDTNDGRSVTDLLDEAVREAERTQMGTSELIGLFFYYAQSLVLDARESMRSEDDD